MFRGSIARRMLVLIVLLGCLMSLSYGVNGASRARSRSFTIGYLNPGMTIPYYVGESRAMHMLAKERGFTLLEIDYGNDPQNMIAATEQMVSKGCDLIISGGGFAGPLGRCVEYALDHKVEFVAVCSPPYTDRTRYGAVYGNSVVDCARLALLAARVWRKQFPNRQPVLMTLGYRFEDEAINREDGFLKGFKEEFPNAKIIQTVPSGPGMIWTREGGYVTAQNTLAANPDINMVYGVGENYTLGALAAFEEAGKGTIKDTLFVGFDVSGSVAEKLMDSNSAFKVALALHPLNTATQAVNMALRILNNQVDWELGAPRELWKTEIYTPDNIKEVPEYLKTQFGIDFKVK